MACERLSVAKASDATGRQYMRVCRGSHLRDPCGFTQARPNRGQYSTRVHMYVCEHPDVKSSTEDISHVHMCLNFPLLQTILGDRMHRDLNNLDTCL